MEAANEHTVSKAQELIARYILQEEELDEDIQWAAKELKISLHMKELLVDNVKLEGYRRDFFTSVASEFFSMCDLNADGIISWDEMKKLQDAFRALMYTDKLDSEATDGLTLREAMQSVFDAFDKDGDGKVTASEVEYRLKRIKDHTMNMATASIDFAIATFFELMNYKKLGQAIASCIPEEEEEESSDGDDKATEKRKRLVALKKSLLEDGGVTKKQGRKLILTIMGFCGIQKNRAGERSWDTESLEKLDCVWEWAAKSAPADSDEMISRKAIENLRKLKMKGFTLNDHIWEILSVRVRAEEDAKCWSRANFKQMYTIKLADLDSDYECILEH